MTSRGQCPRGGGVLVNVFPSPLSGNPVSAPGAHELCCTGARPVSRRHCMRPGTGSYDHCIL